MAGIDSSERAREIGKNTQFTSENAREMQRRGQEVKERKKAEREGLKQMAHIAKQLLNKPVKKGAVADVEEIDNLLELTQMNNTAAAMGIGRMVLGFVNGDKRSTSQLIELLALIEEDRGGDEDDGFLEALNGTAAEDWSDEDE